MFTSRSSILATVATLAAGAALGFIAPTLEASGASGFRIAHLVLAAGWSWAALAFCVGLSHKSRFKSASLAPASLISGVVAYYVTKLEQGKFLEAVNLGDPSQGTQVYWAGFASKTVGWCVAAAFLGFFLGLAGNLARKQGFRSLPFQVLIPLVAIVETTMRLRAEASLQGELASTVWSITRLGAVAVIVALVGRVMIIGFNRPPRRSEGTLANRR